MKKTIIFYLTFFIALATCNPAYSQSKEQVDSINKAQLEWNKFIDSSLSHTSVKYFNAWLSNNATHTQYLEGKFTDFYNSFVQQQYNLWIQKRKRN